MRPTPWAVEWPPVSGGGGSVVYRAPWAYSRSRIRVALGSARVDFGGIGPQNEGLGLDVRLAP